MGEIRRLNSFKPFQGLFCISTMFFVVLGINNSVSNPSRDYSAFLHEAIIFPEPFLYCFKPFQGLFCISTLMDWYLLAIEEVSNPSRDILHFYPSPGVRSTSCYTRFKPFQGYSAFYTDRGRGRPEQ
jgi:hypothetical protein